MRARLRRRPLLTAFVGLVLLAGGASAGYGYASWSESRVSAAAVGAEIGLRLAADSTARALPPGVHEVYAARGGAPVWLAAQARGAALTALREAGRDALPLDSALAALSAAADTAATARSLADLDLAITGALLRFGEALGRPQVDAAELYGVHWTPAPPTPGDPAAALAEALATPGASPDAAHALAQWADALRPQHPGYRRLRAVLGREMDLAALPPLTRDLAPGDSGAAVGALRERLAAEGAGLAPSLTPGRTFDAETARALRELQRRRGLAETGRLDAATRRLLNRRRPELVPLLQVNLEKWRWLPRDLGDLHVWVNVPRFELALRERAGDDWADAIRFRAVVGARDWQTPAFTDTLERVVFNPTWTVPPSIQRESYGRVRGRVVRPPGPGNAMGRVKFLFPNRHSVYVHDTPTKWAFGVDDRARSHGCIRAGDPEGLARELLTRTNGWEPERVAAIFRGSWRRTQGHRVEKTVPVHLVYFTAAVDPDGQLRLFDDVYGRDAVLAEALGIALPEMSSERRASLIADDIGDEREGLAEDDAEERAPGDTQAEADAEPDATQPERRAAAPADRPAPAARPAPPAQPTARPRAPAEPAQPVRTPPVLPPAAPAAPSPRQPVPPAAVPPEGPPVAVPQSGAAPADSVRPLPRLGARPAGNVLSDSRLR